MAHKTIIPEELPQRLAMRKRQYHGPWHYRPEKIGDYSPHTILYRVLEHYLGKDINDAFTHYCKLVKIQHQSIFWETVNESKDRRYRYIYQVYADDDNLLREVWPLYKKKTTYKVPSWDIEYGYLDVETGKIYSGRDCPGSWSKGYYWNRYKYGAAYKGQIYEFESREAKYWNRFYTERAKKKKEDRKKAKEKKAIQYSFISKAELQLQKEKQLDLINRDRHGFTPLSFTNSTER